MKKFISRLVWFNIPILLLFVLGLFLPATPRSSKSLLFAGKQKDELLSNVKSPRMIFVGGSNLSFGLDSRMLKDQLNVNPINTGVHASIGIHYMLTNTIQYVEKGDIVVLCLEYSHFYRDYNYVSDELLRTVIDVDPTKFRFLTLQQKLSLTSYMPKYSLSKFNPIEYFSTESDVYSVNSFNEYGDVDAHWGIEQREFLSSRSIVGQFNQLIILHILDFQKELNKKGATLFVTYPGYQASSYTKSIEQIEKVAIEYEKNDFTVLGHPERYKMPDSMMFDTSYHLTKEGVDYRTRLFISDYEDTRSP